MATKTVLFICVENSCRSLMPESMFNANPPEGWRAISAGTEPGARPNPRTESMLHEVGLKLPDHSPQLLSNEMMNEASVRITMGCLDSTSCPARLHALPLTDWALPDPAKLDDEGFRHVRDQVAHLVRRLRIELLVMDRRREGARSRAPNAE